MPSITEIAIDLPAIDGNFSIGLAACGESGLEKIDMLAVAVAEEDHQTMVGISIHDVLSKAGNMDIRLKRVLVSAVLVCYRFSLIAKKTNIVNGEPDGDWYIVNSNDYTGKSFTAEERVMIEEAKRIDEIRSVASMIAATKVNWYKENHHTGQGRPSSYIKKLISARLDGVDESQAVNVLHRIGHWASTKAVLMQLGLQKIAPAFPIYDGRVVMTCTNDLTIRIRSSPAGTARHFLAFALAKRLLASTAIVLCPNWTDFMDLARVIKQLEIYPAAFHVGSDYLCTGVAEYAEALEYHFNDMDAERYLGRTGSFGAVYLSSSTIMKSPHISGDRYKSYLDYDADFEGRLTHNKMQQRTPRFEVRDMGTLYGEDIAKKYAEMITMTGAIKNEGVEKFLKEHKPDDGIPPNSTTPGGSGQDPKK